MEQVEASTMCMPGSIHGATRRQHAVGWPVHLRAAAGSGKQNLGNRGLKEREGTNPQEAKLLPHGTTSLVFLCGQPDLFLNF